MRKQYTYFVILLGMEFKLNHRRARTSGDGKHFVLNFLEIAALMLILCFASVYAPLLSIPKSLASHLQKITIHDRTYALCIAKVNVCLHSWSQLGMSLGLVCPHD